MGNDNWVVRLGGLVLTGTTGRATFKALDVKDWAGAPGSTGEVVQNTYGDGGWIGEAFDTPKTLVIPGTIKGPDRPAVRDGFDLLNQSVPRNRMLALVVDEDGLTRHMLVRRDQPPTEAQYLTDTLGQFTLQMVASDPRKFSGDGTAGYTYEASSGLPRSEGGQQFGVQLPFQIGASVVSGSVTITNAGDARPPVTVLLTDVVNPSIVDANGARMDFALTVGPGQILEVDLDKKTVKLNGVNRRNALAGPWIVPAAGTELKFNADTYNTNALMTVRWSDAWS